MPEFQLTDSIMTSLNAQEPWPDNVRLFQPYEVEQILLPDNASCLAVQAFLKMCNLPFEVEMRWNAEFMSPSGRVPFIKCGAFVVSELEPIVQFAANKGVSLCGKLSSEEKAEMRAYMSLITNVLVNAELYISWIDDDTYNAVTKVRNSSVYPWPLGWLQTRAKRNAVAKRLKALHWGDKTLDQVLADVEQCCNSLSQRLGERDYFFGTTPTPLDALVYGHIRALLSANGPKAALMIKPMTTSLLKLVVRIVNCTEMKLKPQEEYLLSYAFQVTRNRLSPERTSSERSTRIKRSKLCVRNTSRENIVYNRTASRDNVSYNQEIIGFKPFASKQIVITTTKDGCVTCKYEDQSRRHSNTTFKLDDTHNFTIEIVEDILDRVDETAFEHINVNNDDKNDFEMVFPDNDKFESFTVKMNEFLDTIEENDATETTVSLGMAEDLIRTGDDSDVNNDILDSDGVVNDKHLEEAVINDSGKDIADSDIYSSNNKTLTDEYLTMSSGQISKSVHSEELIISGSKSTLKFPTDEEISVESLLKYLREREATYGYNIGNYLEVADID